MKLHVVIRHNFICFVYKKRVLDISDINQHIDISCTYHKHVHQPKTLKTNMQAVFFFIMFLCLKETLALFIPKEVSVS